MAKPKIRFVCQSCGYVTAKWLGKCPECGQWDSFVEEMDVPERPGQSYLPVGETAKPKPLHQVAEQSLSRLQTGIREFDRVLGGGIVPGSLVLLGGDPGIGKSTMLLDAGMKFSRNNIKVLYVSGEESEAQTAMRARRLGIFFNFSIMLPSFPTEIHILSYGTSYRRLLHIATYFLRSFGCPIFSFTSSGTSINPNR